MPPHAVSALDWRVLVFTLAIAFATGILFGLFPAVHVSRLDVNSSLERHQRRAREPAAIRIARVASWWSARSPWR